jgi:hypothetical protein
MTVAIVYHILLHYTNLTSIKCVYTSDNISVGLGTELVLSTSMQLYQLVLAHLFIEPNTKPKHTVCP